MNPTRSSAHLADRHGVRDRRRPHLNLEPACWTGIGLNELGLRHRLQRERGCLEERIGHDLDAMARALQVGEGDDARLERHEPASVVDSLNYRYHVDT